MTRWLRRPIVWLPISVGLLGLIAWRSRAWEIADQLRSVDPGPLILAVLLNAVIAVAWAARSARLLHGAGWSVPIVPLIPMTVFANLINNITPGSVGELVRLYLLKAIYGVRYTAGGAIILIERGIAIAYLGTSAAVLWVGSRLGLPPAVIALAILVVAFAPFAVYRSPLRIAPIVGVLPLGRLIGASRWVATTATIRRLEDAVATLLRDPGQTAMFALLSGIVFACYTFQLVLVGRAVGIDLDPVMAWGALGLGVMVGVVSLLPFGLGSTDLVVAGLLSVSGVPLPQAAATVFGYRVVSTLAMGIAGVVSYAVLSASLPESGAAGAIRVAREELAQTEDRA